MWKHSICLVVLSVLLASCGGCAIVDRQNRRTLNKLDEWVRIEKPASRTAAAPVFIPVGLLAGAADAVVVHPIASVPKAADDTREEIWDNPEGSEFRQMMLFVPKVFVTPVFFVGDWALRVLFPID